MPGVARLGDQEIGPSHCTQPKRKGHFGTVFANGIPMSGKGHINDLHLKRIGRYCIPHQKPLITASPNVYAEGRPIGRRGDRTAGNCFSKVVQASGTVFANGG